MSGNVCIGTKIKSFRDALECFRQVFPDFKKHQADFENPANGNFAESLDKPLTGIAGSYHGSETAHIRIPRAFTGTIFDMGLRHNSKTDTWDIIAYDGDAYRFEKKLNEVKEKYAAMETDKTVSKFKGRYLGPAQKVKSGAAPSSVQKTLGKGEYTVQEVEFDLDALAAQGINIVLK